MGVGLGLARGRRARGARCEKGYSDGFLVSMTSVSTHLGRGTVSQPRRLAARRSPGTRKPRRKKEERREMASTLAMRIVSEASRPDVTVQELGRLAESDPAFAIRLLALVNSPAYGLARRVANTRQAAAIVGIRGLRNLALSLSISEMAPVCEDGLQLLAVSVRRAVAARLLAEELGLPDLDAFFTAGLLLESGLLVWARESLEEAAHVARSPAASRVLLERAAGRVPHPLSGSALARDWNLCEEVALAIELHHAEEPPSAPPVARVLWAAERVAAVFEGGDVARERAEAERACAVLGLGDERREAVFERLPPLVEEAGRGLDRDLGPQRDLQEILVDANRGLVALNRHYEEIVQTLERLIQEREELASRLQEANRRLADMANSDGLTGLANKRSFDEHLGRELARADRYRSALALVMLDVDHFKRFNDTWGHLTGDEVLKAVAEVLRTTVRASDIAARYGGEEFAVILPETDLAGGLVLAERVRERVEALRVPGPEGPVSVTVSLGVAALRGPGCRALGQALVGAADAALYRAKDGGRNRCEVGGEVPVPRVRQRYRAAG